MIARAKKKGKKNDKIILAGCRRDQVLEIASSAADLFVISNISVDGDMEGFGGGTP